MKKILSCLMAMAMMFTVCACGSDNTSGDKVKLIVDLHGWMPTINTTATASTPTVYNSPRVIAEKFTELYPDVEIEWARTKSIGSSSDISGEMSSYFINAISKGTCPAIAFTWGTAYQDRDYYIDLTEYLNEPNPFETNEELKGKPWKDAFYDYVWDLERIRTYDGRIVAVPIATYAGTASAVYYNCSLMTDIGLMDSATPTDKEEYIGVSRKFTWDDYMDAVDALTARYPSNKAITDPNATLTAGNWLFQFNLGPAYMKKLESTLDKDGDGKVSGQEKLQGIVDGVFNPVDKVYARELLGKIKTYYSSKIKNGDTSSAQDTKEWKNGLSGFYHAGSWEYSDQNSTPKNYKFNLAPAPMIDDSDSDYVETTWVKGLANYQPDVDLELNLMKPAFYENGDCINGKFDEKKFEYALKFLQYLTTYESNSAMISESNTSLGAIKGVALPEIINNSVYKDCYFPVGSVYTWPTSLTSEAGEALDKIFAQWVKGKKSDADFYKEWNNLQVEDAKTYAEALKIDLTVA